MGWAPLFQSTRIEAYEQALAKLYREGHAYRCSCPRTVTARCPCASGPRWRVRYREDDDFTVFRADGILACHLAAVVDDAHQSITDVVRGADLLDSTPRQIHLQNLLGLPTPRYRHVPVVTTPRGEKLSKQTEAQPLDVNRVSELLECARRHLASHPSIQGVTPGFADHAGK